VSLPRVQVCTLDEAEEEDGNHILICDNCDKGYHLWCIGLAAVPEVRAAAQCPGIMFIFMNMWNVLLIVDGSFLVSSAFCIWPCIFPGEKGWLV
jgi:hypothetical protein